MIIHKLFYTLGLRNLYNGPNGRFSESALDKKYTLARMDICLNEHLPERTFQICSNGHLQVRL